MTTLWLRDGKIVGDENGNPIDCDDCPCDPPPSSSGSSSSSEASSSESSSQSSSSESSDPPPPPDTTCLQDLADQEGRTDPWPNTIYVEGVALNWNAVEEHWEYIGNFDTGTCSGNIHMTIHCLFFNGSYLLNLADIDPNTQSDPKLDINAGTLGPISGGYDPITLEFRKSFRTLVGGSTTCTHSNKVLASTE